MLNFGKIIEIFSSGKFVDEMRIVFDSPWSAKISRLRIFYLKKSVDEMRIVFDSPWLAKISRYGKLLPHIRVK
ncbi:MAG: hypothetical protein F6K22_20220 [Okeania sp. SIO2F4]|uniref:hypothetical protein n=1 Tax=Okeania sp. SIO2F4 TaxID=2607790 RepID=UPI00142A0F7A|nr:hypothetical protein [Okeania sp. SIO2F4]NES04949.1 hypothetical protein [Okeania sp. SIO2F4]